ncbi:hypothetical protein BUC_5006 [Burkholderia pseudomallei 576]|nr:hypothetical protein BUC_5006 [Burkholderia pseudomallei 576]
MFQNVEFKRRACARVPACASTCAPPSPPACVASLTIA